MTRKIICTVSVTNSMNSAADRPSTAVAVLTIIVMFKNVVLL